VTARASGERTNDWETDPDRWLSEVTLRLDGSDGLARLARRTRQPHDLRAWYRSVRATGDWSRALHAGEEAAKLARTAPVRAEFLDGAALAARELGREDVPVRLERAWQASPTLLRLCRWLDSSANGPALNERVRKAVRSCPRKAHRQRVLLHVLSGHPGKAARLLAAAPGLGWSDNEHPGHFGFWLLARLIGPKDVVLAVGPPSLASVADADVGDPARWPADPEARNTTADVPRLGVPDMTRIVSAARIRPPNGAAARAVLQGALRTAAERRAAGVTSAKRRRHYEHAVRLVASCVAVDRRPETVAWAAGVRAAYRRFPAMQAEFERYSTSA
jgi:hypothetical protein